MMPHSVSEARVPILAAALGRGVENGPQRIEIGRAARILAGVGGRRSHFAGPEMADAAVAAREHVVAGRISDYLPFRPIWSWPALRPRRDQRSSVSHHSDHCSNVNRKGMPSVFALLFWFV